MSVLSRIREGFQFTASQIRNRWELRGQYYTILLDDQGIQWLCCRGNRQPVVIAQGNQLEELNARIPIRNISLGGRQVMVVVLPLPEGVMRDTELRAYVQACLAERFGGMAANATISIRVQGKRLMVCGWPKESQQYLKSQLAEQGRSLPLIHPHLTALLDSLRDQLPSHGWLLHTLRGQLYLAGWREGSYCIALSIPAPPSKSVGLVRLRQMAVEHDIPLEEGLLLHVDDLEWYQSVRDAGLSSQLVGSAYGSNWIQNA